MKAHSNVELCLSVTPNQYVLKYVHKGNDATVFALHSQDEGTLVSGR